MSEIQERAGQSAPPSGDVNTVASERESHEKLVDERREKLAAIRAQGVAFPNDFRPSHKAAALHAEFGNLTAESLDAQAIPVCVAGRMMLKRVMGKASFATIQDASGSRAESVL